jgi:hypothetical protein
MRRFSLFLLLAASGCTVINEYEDPELVGDWKLKNDSNSKMSIDLEGDGKSTIGIQLTSGSMVENGTITYKLDWEQTRESEYEIKFKCSNSSFSFGCTDMDFKMECEPKKEGKELDCKAVSGIWVNPGSNPDFDWEDD